MLATDLDPMMRAKGKHARTHAIMACLTNMPLCLPLVTFFSYSTKFTFTKFALILIKSITYHHHHHHSLDHFFSFPPFELMIEFMAHSMSMFIQRIVEDSSPCKIKVQELALNVFYFIS